MKTARSPGLSQSKYEVLGRVASGGMGEIYKVRHRLLDEVRAVKVIRDLPIDQRKLQKRFLREARIAATLRHPNLAQIHDVALGRGGTPYMVLEWIEGRDLARLLRSGAPPLRDALEIALQTLSALEYVHRGGFVHRDISPDNVMIARSEEGTPVVKLIDLGLAKRIETAAALTKRGDFVGKLRYAAPEILANGGSAKPDRRSDLYSFAVLLYELLTGVNPISGTTASEVVAAHLFKEPKPFAATDPEGRIPEALRAVALKGLEKRPDARFQTAAAFAEAIERGRDRRGSPAGPSQERTLVLEPEQIVTQSLRLQVSQRELDETFGMRSEPLESRLGMERWLNDAPTSEGGRGSQPRSLSTTLKGIVSRHRRSVALAGAASLVLAVVVVVRLLAGDEGVGTVVDPPSVKVKGDTALGFEEPVAEVVPEALSDDGGPAASDDSGDATPQGRPPVSPSSGALYLVSERAELTTIFLRELGREPRVVLRDSLAGARATAGSSHSLVLRLSATSDRASLEVYDTLVPACEASVTAELLRLPEAQIVLAQTMRQRAPLCAEAVQRAASLLARTIVPRVVDERG